MSYRSSLWEEMVINENKILAANRGIRISDLEDELNNNSAIKLSLDNNNNIDIDIIPLNNEIRDLTLNNEVINNEDVVLNENVDEIIKLLPQLPQESNIINKSTAIIETKEKEKESIWMNLPIELGHRILLILSDIDSCGYLRMVAKNHPFLPNELIYKSLCELIFLNQTKKRILNVDRWKSWYNMLVYRPRLRTNGFYCLRTTYTRAPCNDNFWEEKIYESIEVKYYRHMRFFNDGKVLYSMDIIDPYDIAKFLQLGQPINKKIFEGTYILSGRDLLVEVPLHYCVVRFKLIVLDGDDGYIGKHNMLKIIEHSSIPLPSNRRYIDTLNDDDRVYFKLPLISDMRFYRHWNWQP